MRRKRGNLKELEELIQIRTGHDLLSFVKIVWRMHQLEKDRSSQLSGLHSQDRRRMPGRRRTFREALTEKDKKLEQFHWNKIAVETKRYRTKHKENLVETIKEAKSGNKRALRRLIEWDKAWLFVSWARERILAAQRVGDHDFFTLLSSSISKKSGCRVYPRPKEEDKEPTRTIQGVLDILPLLTNKLPDREQGRALFKALEEGFLLNGEVEISPLSDPDIFQKYLIRRRQVT